MPRKHKTLPITATNATAPAQNDSTRRYTWEEVSWMTGLSIEELLQLFGRKANRQIAYDSLPPAFDEKLLEELADNEATVISSHVH